MISDSNRENSSLLLFHDLVTTEARKSRPRRRKGLWDQGVRSIHLDEAIIEFNALVAIGFAMVFVNGVELSKAPVFGIPPVAMVFVVVDEAVHVSSALDVHDVLDVGEVTL